MVGTSAPVEFAIQTGRRQDLESLFKGLPGNTVSTRLQVTDRVSATLAGPKDLLEIALRRDPFRTLVPDRPATWIWDVRPLRPGEAYVTLDVFSYLKFGDKEDRVQIRALQDTWKIEARGFEWVKYQVSEIESCPRICVRSNNGTCRSIEFSGVQVLCAKATRYVSDCLS